MVAQSAQQLAIGWTTGEQEIESQYGQEFSLLHNVQTSSRNHPESYPVGTGARFSLE
jgi:hypothetical protein